MRQDEYLKRLDRAFTQAPSELTTSVEEAFRRGEAAMKQRHRIMTALSAAAAIAVLCAALALAAGTMLRPRRDNVAAAQRSEAGTGEGGTSSMGRPTPEPTPTPIPQPPGSEPLTIVYTQPNSNYYHSAPGCSGMEGAIEWTEASAISVGKKPCPVCIRLETEVTPEPTYTPSLEAMGRYTPETEGSEVAVNGEANADSDALSLVFYATQDGKYYHEEAHCSGMQGAMPWSFGALWLAGKRPCPVCIAQFEAPEVRVYATPKGRYYHLFRDCLGMKNACALSEAYAREKGKGPCPICISGTDAFCWATPEGTCYHSERECMGMKNARICMESSAQRQGKASCPVCWK